MYYNPETKQILDVQDVRNLLNISFPDGMLDIGDWHFLDEESRRPAREKGKTILKDEIVKEDGKYFQIYKTIDVQEPANDIPVQQNVEQKVEFLEKAMLDVAQMVSNLEDYRMFFEKRLEEMNAGETKSEADSEE